MSSCFGKGWPIRMIRIVCQKFVALNCPLYNRGILQNMRITINCHQSLLSLKKGNGKKQWKCFQDYLPPTSSFFIGPWTQVYACQSLTLSQTCSMTGSRSIRWNIVRWQQALWIIIIATVCRLVILWIWINAEEGGKVEVVCNKGENVSYGRPE